MKRILFHIFLAALSSVSFGQSTWRIDNAHSNVTFAIQWRQNSFRTGEFKIFSGDIVTKKADSYEEAEIEFKVEPTSIDLIASNLISMVQGEEYLNSQEFQEIVFKSTTFKKKHKKQYEVVGKLTIKGTTHETTFLMEDNGFIEYDGRKYGALKVTGQINKSDFKIYGGGDRLGDLILITGYFETVKVED
jgi:polyisoprenoid-binding protein YceI